ncbi:hypothetical protein Bca4012_090181 [Brassica carinata]
MNNEDTMNLNDAEDYMSGDELMDENSDGDEAVAVEDTLMSTAETRAKRVMKWILNPWNWRKLEKKLMKHVKSEFMGRT